MTAVAGTEREQVTAAILLGSNIRPEHYLPAAVRELVALGQRLGVSSVWQTAPVGDENQADFCNAAVALKTSLAPDELMQACRQIEDRLDRVRDPLNKNAARTIDLDLAIYGRGELSIAGKALPDPDVRKRVFVAVPLSEVLPGWSLPDGSSLATIASQLIERDAERLRLVRRHDLVLA